MIIAAAVVLAVVVVAWIDNLDDGGPGLSLTPMSQPMSTPTPNPVPAGALTPPAATPASSGAGTSVKLAWRDDALNYSGTLNWDGRSTVAQLSAVVVDRATGQSLGAHQLAVGVRPEAPNRAVFSTQVPVPGDSQTAGPHSHSVNLVFERQADGHWAFTGNCTAPGRCWEAGS